MKQSIKVVLSISAMTMTGAALAADANLNFTGQILTSSCTVDTGSVTQTINLQSAYVSSFAAVGATSNPTPFSLKLTNCSPSAKVSMTVAGTMDTVASVLKNTGLATQVGVQLLQASAIGGTTGTPITLNSAISLGTVDATASMTIPMVAQFYRLGTMTAGTVTTSATVNFTYN
ncbi:type-1 fimbrial protein [Caballeronia pedi]|uniref:Type-1 fimbrial protein n=1 Tax=Caballeronia pedi TaxID=1777141 RepID=A0A157ZAH6_9BURK|nr:fimbrial protein [Caballeronia pedi]SAK42409.1 type-1 fimbrial protein [Caballeronia pedi]